MCASAQAWAAISKVFVRQVRACAAALGIVWPARCAGMSCAGCWPADPADGQDPGDPRCARRRPAGRGRSAAASSQASRRAGLGGHVAEAEDHQVPVGASGGRRGVCPGVPGPGSARAARSGPGSPPRAKSRFVNCLRIDRLSGTQCTARLIGAPHQGLRPCRHRARHPPRPVPRSHRAPSRISGRPAGQEPPDGPGECGEAGEIRAT